MSHTTSAIGVIWGAFHGELTTVVSVGETESKEVLDKAKRHISVLIALGSRMAKLKRDKDELVGFASGGRIMALPSTGGRGFTGNVFLDEFAYHQNPGKVWDATAAVALLGGRLRISSTPNGFGNDYHHQWRAAETGVSDYSPHLVPIDLAIAQGFPVDLQDCWQLAKNDPRLFDQMFNCKFLDGELQYIPSHMVSDCSSDDLKTQSGDYFAGLDVGKTVDRTVLTVVRTEGGVRKVQYLETSKRTDPDELQAMVDKAFAKFKIKRLCVDASGLGSFEATRMQKRIGYWKVEPIVFTLGVKEDLATELYSSFANRTVAIPKTDDALPPRPDGMKGWPAKTADAMREDICSLRREITTAGNVRYDAPHTDKGHADSAWSLALALHAAGQAQPRGHVPANVAAAL
jgi:phage FluMu gp28-like protein